MKPYYYMFVRQDLSHQQQIIQASHAVHVMSYCLDLNDNVDPQHTNAVLIGVKDESELHQIKQYLSDSDIEHEIFYEPDIDGCTAISTYPLRGEKRKPLAKFSTM